MTMTVELVVNEAKLFATATAGWWTLYRSRGPEYRFRVITASIGGDLVGVACDDREHATWVADALVASGAPRSALRIARV
jgi:hypothetical protein